MYSDNFVKSKLNIGGFLPLPPLIKLTAMIFESGTKHPSYQIRYADKGNNYMTIWNTKRWGNRYLHNNRHNVGAKLAESQLLYISQALLFIYQP
jgi:hypothetical protein